MRTRTILATAFIAALFLATPAIAADKTAAVEKEITKIEHEMAAASVKNDVEILGRYTAPEWTFITPVGEVWTWPQTSEILKKGGLKTSAAKLDEVKVKVYDNTAIAFVLTTQTTTFNGQDISGQYRGIDVFVKRDSKWKVVASQVCKVEK